MIYQPPTQWTEKEILKLSGEDDRYEFKSGGILTDPKTNKHKLDDKLCNELAVEICAFANSFGGTLFLGIRDNKKIDGVSTFYKDKKSNPFKEWLEKKIGQFLEFRLPNYRVTEVTDLSDKTKQIFNDEKVIIAIDVFESDLAPHQCKFDNKYYFRQSSNSNPAPHHYLAYLWSRTNSNMSNVVSSWFRLYLNHFITLLEKTAADFSSKSFNSIDVPIKTTQIHIRNIIFFNVNSWTEHNSSLTAKHFLRTYPAFNSKINEFTNLIQNFNESFAELENEICKTPELERRIRTLLDMVMERERVNDRNFNDKSFEEVLRLYASNVFEKQYGGISNHPSELKGILCKMTAYNLLSLELDISSDYTILYNFSKEHIANQFDESLETLNMTIEEVSNLMRSISKMAEEIYEEADELRHSLALRHNTTYE